MPFLQQKRIKTKFQGQKKTFVQKAAHKMLVKLTIGKKYYWNFLSELLTAEEYEELCACQSMRI
jgi:hypothetical protein